MSPPQHIAHICFFFCFVLFLLIMGLHYFLESIRKIFDICHDVYNSFSEVDGTNVGWKFVKPGISLGFN